MKIFSQNVLNHEESKSPVLVNPFDTIGVSATP